MIRNDRPPARPATLDTAKSWRAAGDVAYDWCIETDAMVWSDHAIDVSALLHLMPFQRAAPGRNTSKRRPARAGSRR